MQEGNEDRPNYFLFIAIIILLIFILVVLIYYIRFRVSITPSASGPNLSRVVSVSNSYVFASPVRAKAGGDLIRITVFLLDDVGLGVFGKEVILNKQDSSLNVANIQNVTDENGRAIFDISADTLGRFEIEVFSENVKIGNISVLFD